MKSKDIEVKCIVCGKQLKPLEETEDSHPVHGCWDYATVDWLNPGYGSRFDLSRLIVGMCDDCIDKKLQEGILIQDKEQEAEDWRQRHAETKRIVEKMKSEGRLLPPETTEAQEGE